MKYLGLSVLGLALLASCGSKENKDAEATDDLTVPVEEIVEQSTTVVEGVVNDSTEEAQEATSGEAVSSEDIDKTLDSLESLVNECVETGKKAMDGDMAATLSLAGQIMKANEVLKQLDAMKGDMSAAQLGRLAKIASKLSELAN